KIAGEETYDERKQSRKKTSSEVITEAASNRSTENRQTESDGIKCALAWFSLGSAVTRFGLFADVVERMPGNHPKEFSLWKIAIVVGLLFRRIQPETNHNSDSHSQEDENNRGHRPNQSHQEAENQTD